MGVFVGYILEEINDLHAVGAGQIRNSPVLHTLKSFCNPYIAQFIVVFNNVWPAASWRSCPHCIYFLSDAPHNNSVIPCGPTTQTAKTPTSLTSGPLPHPSRQRKTHSPLHSPHYILHFPLLHSYISLNAVFPPRCCAYSPTQPMLSLMSGRSQDCRKRFWFFWSFRSSCLVWNDYKAFILIFAHETEDILTWKTLLLGKFHFKLQKSHSLTGDHRI